MSNAGGCVHNKVQKASKSHIESISRLALYLGHEKRKETLTRAGIVQSRESRRILQVGVG